MPDIPLDFKPPYAQKNDCKPLDEPIDVVITWVNGTDPKFLEQLYENEPQKASETEPSRFRDMNQLKYAIRSFQKYAPWVRDIILLTNGQGFMFINLRIPSVFSIKDIMVIQNSCTNSKFLMKRYHGHLGPLSNFEIFE